MFDVQFHSYKPDTIVSCGVKHIKFWKLCGNALTAKKGIFGKVGEIQTMLCLGFGPDDVTFSGTLGGDVYVWKGTQLSRVVQDAHRVSVNELNLFCYIPGSGNIGRCLVHQSVCQSNHAHSAVSPS